MRLTHFGHSCVLAQTDTARVLIDPGTFSAGFEDVRDLDAILLTHQHPDHLDMERLPALLEANPRAHLFTDVGSATQLESAGISCRRTQPGDSLHISGLDVTVVGDGEHAVIHPDIPVIPNNGYLLDGSVLHPGD